jgi:hypothetical protein
MDSSIEQENGYELTAIPVVALLMQYNQIRQPSLHMMGHLAEPNRLFYDMQRMGVRVTASIRCVSRRSPKGDVKMSGRQVGQVNHYFDHINVASLTLTEPLHVGDTVHILGHSTDLKHVDEAKPGDDVGMKVIQKVHAHDKVFKLTNE